MSKKTWVEVVNAIRPIIGDATSEQKKLLHFIGLDISENLPRVVVAAKLRDHLAEVLALSPPQEPGSREMSLIKFLKEDHDVSIKPQSNSEAEAWGHYLCLLRRMEHLERIKIEAGDIVGITNEERLAEVSSIGEEGRVYFKGGYGAGSWPDLLTVRAKWNDNSSEADLIRKTARNHSTQSAPIAQWSEAKHRELREYACNGYAIPSDIEQLEKVIDSAKDEKNIQKYLEKNPHIFMSLLYGTNKYCIPQKRLGAEYIPDFLISGTDSLGINWILIELETPKSSIYLKTTDQLDEYARKGVAQIQEWREWLTSNIAYARTKNRENGLGLIDIRPSSQAIVIVGRRKYLRETKEVSRNQLRDKENIHIHTYDWLIETLYGALNFDGLPRRNPYLLKPDRN